jgi:uncharacterized membrane protein YeaQ/YmgE (transglycosylase-associated protein family)
MTVIESVAESSFSITLQFMSIGQVILYVVIAVLCGFAGQRLAGRSVGGFVVSLVVGLTGSMLGSYLAAWLRAPEPLRLRVGDQSIPFLWAIIGATLVTLAVSLVQRVSRRA